MSELEGRKEEKTRNMVHYERFAQAETIHSVISTRATTKKNIITIMIRCSECDKKEEEEEDRVEEEKWFV